MIIIYMDFYKNIIKKALIIFFILTLFISVIIILSKDEYPQTVNPCPDHWVYDSNQCKNVHNIGTIDSITIGSQTYNCKSEPSDKPFSDPWWNDRNGTRKRNWAQNCNQPWTGVWPAAYGNYVNRGDQYDPYNPFKNNKNR
jgi:hypothetical protein